MRTDAFVYTPRGRLDRQDYVKQFAPLVRRLAHQMVARLPANVELDDMVQAGMIGLMDAVGRFEESQGTQFEVYAASRIRGAMLDELRANDWLPRSARKSQRDIENAIHRLEGKLKRAPAEAEIARELNISVAEYQEMLNEARGAQLIYFDDLGGRTDDEDYLERHVADMPTTCGCAGFDRYPETSATAVQRALDAGALFVGKQTLDQFATGLNGTRTIGGHCLNVFDPDVIPGRIRYCSS